MPSRRGHAPCLQLPGYRAPRRRHAIVLTSTWVHVHEAISACVEGHISRLAGARSESSEDIIPLLPPSCRDDDLSSPDGGAQRARVGSMAPLVPGLRGGDALLHEGQIAQERAQPRAQVRSVKPLCVVQGLHERSGISRAHVDPEHRSCRDCKGFVHATSVGLACHAPYHLLRPHA